jgi:hypothetical protein
MLEKKTLDLPVKWEETLEELRRQWRAMWGERIDDKVRAEGIARQDYPLLYLERGTVVVATRKYKALDFFEIVTEQRGLLRIDGTDGCGSLFVGGWGKFIRSTLNNQPRYRKRRTPDIHAGREGIKQQKKKGGRGWIHRL